MIENVDTLTAQYENSRTTITQRLGNLFKGSKEEKKIEYANIEIQCNGDPEDEPDEDDVDEEGCGGAG
jgi:hypothetical protein